MDHWAHNPFRLFLRCYFAAVLMGAVSACALSEDKRIAVDELVASHGDLVAASPAQDWPLGPLPVPTGNGHRLILIDRGDDALAIRLHLIRTATESIELQNYIFLPDDSGKLILNELLTAAARGVRVRVLLDSLFSLPDEELLAALELAHDNFELRLFRPLLGQAVVTDPEFIGAIFCCFYGLNQRMHNKLLVIDGRHGLVGGRNHSARYFDLDTRMVFLDLEVLVSGPVSERMVKGFDAFWRHGLVLPPRYTRRVHRRLFGSSIRMPDLAPSPRLAMMDKAFAEGRWLERLLREQSFLVGPVQYFSDLPEARPRWRRPPAGDSTDVIHELIGKASTQLVLQTPYAVLSRRFARLLANLDPVVELRISSNSLASTDAFPVYAVSRKQRAFLLEELGAQLFEAKPYPPSPESFVPRYADLVAERAVGIKTPMRADPGKATREMPGPRLSLHGKIAVVDGRYSIVTSHNFDPRSEGYNTENGIIVDDAAFASALLASVGRITTPEYSWISAMRPAGEGLLAALHRDGARLSRRLPTLDLWPGYRFEIREASVRGAGSVGLAPEVVAWERRWVTAMISRMLGFLRPLM